MDCTSVRLACLSGAPIGGGSVEDAGGIHLQAQILGAIVLIIGAGFLLVAMLVQRE